MPLKHSFRKLKNHNETDIDADETTSFSERLENATTNEPPAPSWKALFFFTTHANIWILVGGIICSTLSGIANPFQNYLVGKLLEGFISYAAGTSTTENFKSREQSLVLYLVLVAGFSWIFHSLEFMFWLSFGELQAKSARDRLFHGLLLKDVEWYDMRKNGIGALLPRVQAQIRDLQLATSQPLGLLVSATAQCIFCLGEAFYYQWKLTLVILSTMPIIVLLFALTANVMRKSITQQQEKLAEAQKHTSNAFAAIDAVKCYNGQNIERQKYMAKIREAAAWYLIVVRASGCQMAYSVFFTSAMFVQGFYYGGVLLRKGEADVSRILITFLGAMGGFQALQLILPQMTNLEKGRRAGTTLRAVMAEVRRSPTVRKCSGALAPSHCRGEIQVTNLTFSYPSRSTQPVLQNVNLHLPAGDMTFLIGKSGSGKSTLSQLLLGFYEVREGQVAIDGIPINRLNVAWLRSNITVVEQQSLLFNDTVFRNIAFGCLDYQKISKKQVMQAAEFALLRHTINDMPKGLDTPVGFRGGSMSGGQRQRMALARARLRDTPILILDESTSALDHISRALMMEAIRRWRCGKTTVIITHDVSQIMADDYVYVLEHGRLVQEGYRKHLEKMKNTSFQDLLPLELQATISPFDARKPLDGDSVYKRGSSMEFESNFTRSSPTSFDPLEAHLDATARNKHRTFLPAAWEGAVPVMGAFGRVVPGMPSLPPVALTPLTTPPDFTRLSQVDMYSTQLRPTSTDGSNDSKRLSIMLQQLVNRAGRSAVDSRFVGVSTPRTRRPIGNVLNSLDVKDAVNTAYTEMLAQQSVHVTDWTLTRVLTTTWTNANGSARIRIMLGIYGCAVHALATPTFSYLLSKLISTYTNPTDGSHKQLVYAFAILGVSACDAMHTALQRFMLGHVSQIWVDDIRDKAVERILDQPKLFFDSEENVVSHLVDCLDRNAEAMRELVGNFAALAFIALVMCLIAIAWALSAQWKMTLIALLVSPYILGVSRLFASISGKWETRSTNAAESASAVLTEVFTNIKTVRALTLEAHFREKYAKATQAALVIGLQRSFHTGFFFGLSTSASSFATALVFYIGSWLIANGTPAVNVIQVVVMLMFALANISLILECIPQVGGSRDAASRLLRLAHLPKDSHEHLGDTRVGTVGKIVFDNLRFGYPTRPEHTVLNRINLTIQPGIATAIVGGSGSGKSTIANLLLDLWSTAQITASDTASTGQILIAGRDIRTLSTPSLRSAIVPVLQTPTLFAGTIAENISYGLPAYSPYRSKTAIIDAGRRSGIHDFISSLPLGYDTPVGDGGMGLSGGQIQRLAMARALIRKPSVLILDEATSALDGESAALVRQTIKELVQDKTRAMAVLIITHNREMMELAQHVVVLDEGSVVEEGTFEELVRKGGALTNLLSGGLWGVGASVEDEARVDRSRGVPELREVDWNQKRRVRRLM